MADIIEQAVGEILVKDSTSFGVKSATANFQQLYNVVRFNWWGIQNLGNAFAGVGGMIAGGLGSAVHAAVGFEQGLAQVGRTADLTGKPLEAMGKSLRDMALQKPISVDALTKIAADAGALGITGVDNITKFTGTIADLVATTNLTEDSAVQLARLGGVLGLQGDQWHQLGSAILYAGVHSAATEKDIVNMAVRLSGAAAAAHMTAPEIVALASVTTSLGSSSQVAATSVNRMIQQIAKAAATGTPSLAEFAHVAGYDGPDAAKRFGEAFNRDAAQAIAQFVTGIGKMRGNTIATNKVLIDLGFNSQRGAQTILQAAAGTQQHANQMLNLNVALRLTSQAYERNTELTKQANQIYGTTQNQLKMTENAVKDIAIGFGEVLLPVLNAVLQPIASIIWGFDQLSPVMKEIITVVGVLAAGLLLVVGGALAMAPRLILMAGAFKEFQGFMMQFGNTAKMTVYALNEQAAAEGKAADYTAMSAAKVARAKRVEAVARVQNEQAKKAEMITTRGEMEADLALMRAKEELRLAYAQETVATEANARAKGLRAEMVAAEAAGDAELASGLLVDAECADEDALAANRSAMSHRERATAAQMDAIAARENATALVAESEAALAASVAEEEATGAAYGLGLAMDTMLGPIGIAFAAISALAIGLGIFGNKHRDAAKAAQELQQADMQLAGAIRTSTSAMGAAVVQYYQNNQAFLALAGAVHGYINELVLMQTITGAMGQAGVDAAFANIDAHIKSGDQNAVAAKKSLIELIQQHNAAVIAAREQAATEKKTGQSTKDMGDASSKAADQLGKLKSAHEAINQAVMDLPEAMIAEQQATLAAKQAQQDLAAAYNAGAQHARDVASAEANLAQARLDVRKSEEDLAAAEYNLAHAREQAANDFADAQAKVKDDEDRLYEAHQKIQDIEQKIADLRAGPSAKELRDATNKLADANIRLLNSQKKVQDSQYMLNYLMAEGASNRDLTDAQDNLAAAQQDVADQTANVSDAQKELSDLQNPDNTKAMADAERELAAAERDLAAQQRQLKTDQEALNQSRKDLHSDKAYKDAQIALKEAQMRVAEALRHVKEEQEALTAERKKDPADEVKDKQLALEQALYNLAKAHVRVTKDTALMHGEQFGAGREARALADALGGMAARADGPVKQKLLNFMGVLRQSVSDIKDAGAAADSFGGGGGGAAAGDLKNQKLLTTPALPDPGATGKSWSDKLVGWFKDHWREIAVGVLAVLAFVFGPGEIGLLAAAIGLAAAEIAHIFIGFWDHGGKDLAKGIWHGLSRAWDAVVGFFEKDVPKYFWKAVHAIGNFFKDHGKEIAVGLIGGLVAAFLIVTLGVPGLVIGLGLALIAGIVKVVSEHWSDITDFFTKTIPDFLKNHWQTILDAVTGPFGLAINWVHDNWGKITEKFQTTIDWVKKHWPLLLEILTGPFGLAVKWVHDHWGAIKEKVDTLRTWIRDHWHDILGWLTHPFDSAVNFVHKHFGDLVGFITGLPGRIGRGARHIFDWVGTAMMGPLRTVQNAWNNLWEGFGNKSIHFGGWKVAGHTVIPGFDWGLGWLKNLEFHLPGLAEGGLVMNPTLVAAGEKGAEAIIPLDKLTAMFAPVDSLAMEMRAVAHAMESLLTLQAGGGVHYGGDTFNFHEVMADPVDIVREVVWTKKVRLR